MAVFQRHGRFIPLLEAGIEMEADETLLRLAPGLYWQPRPNVEFGVALPIGLTKDTPNLGVFALATFEFGGDSSKEPDDDEDGKR
ncbi:MAG: hypothetical protein NTW96_16365 [Planctomycetia bacterium]|nr:hypothetical protein [Planctomycetia bacterium]